MHNVQINTESVRSSDTTASTLDRAESLKPVPLKLQLATRMDDSANPNWCTQPFSFFADSNG